MMLRIDDRAVDELRPVKITPGYVVYPEGSVLMEMGNTRVLCNATIENKVPRWIKVQKKPGGWVTAEYAMLPRATQQRTPRETRGLRGRTQEIKRLIGRSLRAAINLDLFDGYTCIVDCDVLQADGGTRTAAITGSYVALALALRKYIQQGALPPEVLDTPIAAVSVGMVDERALLDLCYTEDVAADVDCNVVLNGNGDFIEVQGTAEGAAFSRSMLDQLLDLAQHGTTQLFALQHAALEAGA